MTRDEYQQATKEFAQLEQLCDSLWDTPQYHEAIDRMLEIDQELRGYEAGDFHTFDLLTNELFGN